MYIQSRRKFDMRFGDILAARILRSCRVDDAWRDRPVVSHSRVSERVTFFTTNRVDVGNSNFARGDEPNCRWISDILWLYLIPAHSSELMSRTAKYSRGYGYSSSQSKLPRRYGNSHAIWDHTVLPATRQRWHSRLYLSRSWYSITKRT